MKKILNSQSLLVCVLIKILRTGIKEENVYDYYREMSSKGIRTDIVEEWIRVMGITDDMVKGIVKYHPVTTGQDVMKDGFKGKAIGEEIKRREGERYVSMVKGVKENKIVKYSDFLNKKKDK